MKSDISFYKRIIICFAALVLSVVLGICAGAQWISPAGLISDMLLPGLSPNERIVLYIRLPRVLAAMLAGAALAVSGTVIQAVLANPLAAPNIIGTNAGAGLFTVICITFFPSAVQLLPGAAFAGALFAVLTVYVISRKAGASRMTLVLTGVGLSSLLNALTDTVTTLYPDSLIGITSFKIGGLEGMTTGKLFPAWIYIVIGITAVLCLGHDLDVLSLGEVTAKSLGMNVELKKFIFLAAAAMLCGAAVSFSGLIGFVGLIVPHMSARIAKSRENTRVLPVCILTGAAFLTLCDTVSRTVAAPYELPLGIIVSYIGVPFFIWLLLKKRGGAAL